MKIQLQNEEIVEATYVRHVTTLTSRHGGLGNDNIDVDLYRLHDGRMVEAQSPANDCRVMPVEMQ